MLTLRFDMRAPASGAPKSELYAAAIEMCSWAETRGAISVVLSEHHATEDNHLPAPLLLASAIAARTTKISIMLAAVVLPLYNPVRLAEEISLLDIISNGRMAYVFGIGHREEEYEHIGIAFNQRGKSADTNLALLLELLKGQPIVKDGRRIHVTPAPVSPGGPRIMIGGGTTAAIKRAARHGLGFIAQGNPPGLLDIYIKECRAHGHTPGFTRFTNPDTPTTVFVAENIDKAWEELGEFILHDAKTAASYREGQNAIASISRASSVDELRASPGAYRIYSIDEAVTRLENNEVLPLLPLCGGLPPPLAWNYLKNATNAVSSAHDNKQLVAN
jgi:alkanesulfonate monooxygenase SsuD/methylene tetrahydromethanopterin reductase-like flavin-dependent oxidoreductase (luciferase family)